jgi:acyl-ACP thioesterase
VLDLIEVTRRDLQHLRQRRLAEAAFAPELAHPRSDKRFCHVRQPNNRVKPAFALLADPRLWQDREPVGVTGENQDMAGIAGSTGLGKVMMPVPDPHPDVFDRQWPLRVADIDREGRLRFDAATRHIQDIGSDHLRELGFEETHPLWIVRRTMIDLIKPIDFQDMLRLRRWCSGTSNRWCEMRVRIDGRRGRGLMESEAFWININRETQGPARIADDFIEGLQRTTDVDRLRWKAYLTAGSREDAAQIREYPVRVSDIDIFDHMNNSVYWTVIEDYLFSNPELLHKPIRVTIEHDAPVALGDKLEIISHVHPAGSTEQFGAELADHTVRTLTYVVGDETKAVASIFAL